MLVWRSEANSVELVLTFHFYLGPGASILVIRLVLYIVRWQATSPAEPILLALVYYLLKKQKVARQWWHTPLILAVRRQRQVNLCEFKANKGNNTEKLCLEKPTNK